MKSIKPLRLFLVVISGGMALLHPAPAAPADPPKIQLADTETIAFLGDSITAWQPNYSLYAGAYLVSRFPGKTIVTHTFGYGGQTAELGIKNFTRDIAAVKPTTVFVDFGMNDGKYKAFDAANYKWYLDSQRELARVIKESGAREILMTTSPTDPERRADKGLYNETLGRMADGVLGLGQELGVPVADIFHPMQATQARAKAAQPGYTMIIDSVHPNPVGHLVMAYHLLSRIDAPRVVSDITIKAGGPAPLVTSSEGAKPENVVTKDGAIDFDLALPFLPFYVPPEAREALQFVPFQQELNRFRLQATGWDPARKCALIVNKRELGTFTPAQLASGIDLALLEGAPWTDAAKQLLDVALVRGNRVEPLPDYRIRNLPSFAKLQAANADYLTELGGAMKGLAQPRAYHLSLVSVDRVLGSLEVSPIYPANSFAGDFDKAFAPETAPETVAWKPVPLQNGEVDFLPMFGNVQNCVVYCRAVLQAPAAGKLHLEMGSDDGLTVFVNGQKLLANNATRGMTIGDDKLDAELKPGRNILLFRISQNAAGFRFGVVATPLDGAKITQVEAPL